MKLIKLVKIVKDMWRNPCILTNLYKKIICLQISTAFLKKNQIVGIQFNINSLKNASPKLETFPNPALYYLTS